MMQSADHATGRVLWEIEEVVRRLSAAQPPPVVSVYGHNFAVCGPQVFFILDDMLMPTSGAIMDECVYRTGLIFAHVASEELLSQNFSQWICSSFLCRTPGCKNQYRVVQVKVCAEKWNLLDGLVTLGPRQLDLCAFDF